MKINRYFLMVVLSVLPFTAAHSALYKWVDADGNVSYSNQKPPDQAAETLRLRNTKSLNEAKPQPSEEGGEEKAANTQGGTEEGATDPSDHQTLAKKNCEIGQKNLEVLGSGGPVSVAGSDGEPRVLSAEELAAKKAEMQALVDVYCK